MKNLRFSLLILLAACLLTGCSLFSGRQSGTAGSNAPLYLRGETALAVRNAAGLGEGEAEGLTVVSPSDGAVVPLLRPAQKAYVSLPLEERIPKFANARYRKNELSSDGDWPFPVCFSWESAGDAGEDYTLCISESPDMTAAASFRVSENRIEIFNFKIGVTYYWTVVSGRLSTGIHSFTTEATAPRLMRIDGISNSRDLGGRIGLAGRRVRQGMIYRSTQLNGHSTFKRISRAEALRDFPEQVAAYDSQRPVPSGKKIPFCAGREWTVFRFDHSLDESVLQAFHALTEIPADFAGVQGIIQAVDEEDRIAMPPMTDMPALYIQEFTAPEAGYIRAGAGGDWFWRLAVNGRIIQNLFDTGNTFNPVDKSNYIIDIPVRKGKNILTVVLRSGMNGWDWCFGETSDDIASMVVAIPGDGFLSDSMQKYAEDCLGLKTELDLRNHGESDGLVHSPLGPQAAVLHISSGSYEDMEYPQFREAFANAFRVFLDEKNYPVTFHCVAGQDRTGALALILNALLGVDENELYLDWECTGFWNKGNYFRHDTRLNRLIGVFDAYPGATINERVEAYVRQCGISDSEIRAFRCIMLE